MIASIASMSRLLLDACRAPAPPACSLALTRACHDRGRGRAEEHVVHEPDTLEAHDHLGDGRHMRRTTGERT